MALDPTKVGKLKTDIQSFVNADGTKLKIIRDCPKSQIIPAIAGENPYQGETLVRQDVLRGGCELIDIFVTSSDTAARNINVYIGEEVCRYDASATGAMATSGTTIITRTTGDFRLHQDGVNRGLEVGHAIIMLGATSAGNNGVLTSVASLTATQITTTAAGVAVAESQGASFRIIQVGQVIQLPIPIGAGTGTASPNPVKLTDYPAFSVNQAAFNLGAYEMILGAMAVAVTANYRVDVIAQAGLH